MSKVIALACAAICAGAPLIAGPDRISILLGSEHFGSGGFEEFNPGLFATWEGTRADFSLGAYRNSYAGTSVAVSAALPLAEWETGALDAFAALAYYDNADDIARYHFADIVPLAGLQLRQGFVFAQFVPMDGAPVDALLTFGITFPLN
ncbi:MAG: hypothetical protein AAF841_04440 [Pseudomonadota bacterium]